MSVHFKILSGILTLVTGKSSFMNMKNQSRSKEGLYIHMSLKPDHCRTHRSPAGVVDGEVTASGLRTAERNPGFWATPARKGNMLIHK